jgi:hypothetical protein
MNLIFFDLNRTSSVVRTRKPHTHTPRYQKILSCPGERAQHRASSQQPGSRSKFPSPSAPRPRPPCSCPPPTPPAPPTTVSAAFPSPPPTPRLTSAMRIRRYAARLLSSTSPGSAATAAPSSPPRPPAASWLHTDDDDCCAFCELSRPASQVTRCPPPPLSLHYSLASP